MAKIKYLFRYKGDIVRFDHVVYPQWGGRTYAVSEKQALNNLRFQAKQFLHMDADAQISLVGKLEKTNYRLLL